METVEIIGLAASCTVLISFLMRRMWIVRVISIIACVLFIAYGIMLESWVLWGLNGALILIHLIFLTFGGRKKRKGKNRLCRLRDDCFAIGALRKPNWFFTSRGDDYVSSWE